jgi:hypothetical protein
MIKAIFSRRLGMYLGIDGDTWNALTLIFLAATAIAAFGLLVSQRAVIVLQKEADLASKEKIVILENASAKANERAALLEKEAATARLEQERLKQELAWREITKIQALKIKEIIGDFRMQITISWPSGDAESAMFAKYIGAAILTAGSEISAFSPMVSLGTERFGVFITGSEQEECELLASSLRAIGVEPLEVNLSQRKVDGSKYFTNIFVGHRQPPTLLGDIPPKQ